MKILKRLWGTWAVALRGNIVKTMIKGMEIPETRPPVLLNIYL